MNSLNLRPIGVVRCQISKSSEMPKQGIPARVEVFSEYAPGLLGIERSTHVMVLGWLHQADRDVLQVRRPRYTETEVRRGVFACRAPVRPNPLGVTIVKLLNVEGNVLHVDGLDMTDGTPVLDLKPHAAGFDGVFCARRARDLSRLADPDSEHALRSMVREAENFHGERCAGVVAGARMVYHAMKIFGIAQKDPRVVLSVGEDGCMADSVQALVGATFGNKRLECGSQSAFVLSCEGQELWFRPRYLEHTPLEELLEQDIDALFDCEVSSSSLL